MYIKVFIYSKKVLFYINFGMDFYLKGSSSYLGFHLLAFFISMLLAFLRSPCVHAWLGEWRKDGNSQCIEKGWQQDNFVYSVNKYFFNTSSISNMAIIILIRHISTFLKEKQDKVSDENVLLLTHCAGKVDKEIWGLPTLMIVRFIMLASIEMKIKGGKDTKNSAKFIRRPRNVFWLGPIHFTFGSLSSQDSWNFVANFEICSAHILLNLFSLLSFHEFGKIQEPLSKISRKDANEQKVKDGHKISATIWAKTLKMIPFFLLLLLKTVFFSRSISNGKETRMESKSRIKYFQLFLAYKIFLINTLVNTEIRGTNKTSVIFQIILIFQTNFFCLTKYF